MEHIVKLRPGLNQFLSQLTSLYDLHIYTHGTRKYAEVIAKIIDPEQKFFRDRIVARTDTPDVAHKSLKLLFPSCDDSMILVLDDRIDVWHENPDNVMLIEPYHFFTSSAEINNASGRSMIQIGSLDAEDKKADEHLTVAMNVLKVRKLKQGLSIIVFY
jgi:RNA polymerase II subunit A-like phosphatase